MNTPLDLESLDNQSAHAAIAKARDSLAPGEVLRLQGRDGYGQRSVLHLETMLQACQFKDVSRDGHVAIGVKG